MGKTYRDGFLYGMFGIRPDNSRRKESNHRTAWNNVHERANRRAVSIALRKEDWEQAMDIGQPEPSNWRLR